MLLVWFWRLVVVVVIVLGWQYVPKISGLNKHALFDPYFVSSPSRIAHELWLLASGSDGVPAIWPALARTVLTALLGTVAALIIGTAAGLLLSAWPLLELVARPFLVVANAVPRIATIPIVILLVGSSTEADALVALNVVFFLVFYNAYEGSASVPREVIENAQLLGASRFGTVLKVRGPYALAWTMTSIPNAIAFGLIGAVTAEVFTGSSGGMGYELSVAVNNVNSDLLFAVVFMLAVVGVLLVLGGGWLRRRLMPWWESSIGT